MDHLGLAYYAGLLTAAEYHGAAHQRPQVFQVVVEENRPEVSCGKIRVWFIARRQARLNREIAVLREELERRQPE